MFLDALKDELLYSSKNYFKDNYDYYAFGHKKPFKKNLINHLKKIFFSRFFLSIILNNKFLYKKFFLGFIHNYTKHLEPLDFFYKNLTSDESKSLLVKLVSFRLLGYVKVRLPLSKIEYWEGIKEMEKGRRLNDKTKVNSFPWELYLHEIRTTNETSFKVYLNTKAAYTTFILQQYIKITENKHVGPDKDDVVIDLGACYGDTALLFSNLVGEQGKVYSFEFIPGNLSVFKKNISINPSLAKNIEIIEHPSWDISGEKIYYKDMGSGSTLSFSNFDGSDGETTTLSIDDFIAQKNISKLDFIKTDIEGAEPYVLRGAINTLKKFTPKLAISIYHNMSDFTGIIRQIDDLNLGYKFYLGHYTIYASETILYAIKEK